MKILASVFLFTVVTQSFAIELPAASADVPSSSVSAPHVTRSKKCPAGFELTGNRCRATEVVAAQYICPSGTTFVDGQCSTFRRANRECPTSYRLNNEICSSTQSLPADFVCKSGDLDSSGRGCREVKEVAPVCPAGYVKEAAASTDSGPTQCVRFSLKQKKCPAGYSFQGAECTRTLTFSAEPQCPASFELAANGNSCNRLIPVPAYCQSGFVLEEASNECVHIAQRIAAPCPTEYRAINESSCEKPVQHPSRPVCENDFILEGDSQCIQRNVVPPSCPASATRGPSGKCEVPVAEEPLCQNGYNLLTEERPTCRKVTAFPPTLKCSSSSYTLVHGLCKKASAAMPQKKCLHGELQNDQCVTALKTDMSAECPSGFRMTKGSVCIQDVTYDCSTTVSRTVCEMPGFVSDILDQSTYSANGNLRSLEGVDYKAKGTPASGLRTPSPSAPLSASVLLADKTPVCHQVPQVVPKTCSRVERAEVQFVCPEGAVAKDDYCLIEEYQEPLLHCDVGRYDVQTGRCITVTAVNPDQVCPVGTDKDGDQCIQVDTQAAIMVCPEGSQPSYDKKGTAGCVEVKEEIVHPAHVVQKDPQFVCEFGVKRGNVCVDVEVIPRGDQCPQGTVDREGRCLKIAKVIAPAPRLETAPVRFVCPDGKPAQGRSCFAREAAAAEYFCQASGQLDGDRCVHSADLIHPPAVVTLTAATPHCAQGYQLQGDRCVATVTRPALKVCPAGWYSYQEGARECIQNHPQEAVCPPGTIQSSAGCTKISYAPARVTEIREYSKDH